MIIKTKSYPRAAVIGNPSDGYYGKTIAFVFDNFCAEVELWESEKLEIRPSKRDLSIYENLADFRSQIEEKGYYGGIRLMKATIRKFIQYCQSENIQIPTKNFSLTYRSDIPNRLGLAGSSALITAALKAIFQFYQLQISKPIFANLVLSVETEELGISAGLQDRVAQAFEQPVFMDFDKEIMKRKGYGNYETLSVDLLPNFFIAFRKELAQGSEVTHNDLRERFENSDEKVVQAMKKFAKLTTDFFYVLKNEPENISLLSEYMNQNFDLRKSICAIDSNNLEMVEIARFCGASAKFTGSGGAIIGIYKDDKMYNLLLEKCVQKGINLIKPQIVGQ